MAYSEGVFDDVNRAILAGLSSGKFRSSDEVLRAYAGRVLWHRRADLRGLGPLAGRLGPPFRRRSAAVGRGIGRAVEENAARRLAAPPMGAQARTLPAAPKIARAKPVDAERLSDVEEFWKVHESDSAGAVGPGNCVIP